MDNQGQQKRTVAKVHGETSGVEFTVSGKNLFRFSTCTPGFGASCFYSWYPYWLWILCCVTVGSRVSWVAFTLARSVVRHNLLYLFTLEGGLIADQFFEIWSIK